MIRAHQVTRSKFMAEQAPITIRIVEVYDPGHTGFVSKPPRIAARLLRTEALTMKTAETPQNFLAACVLPRNFDRAFVGFRTAQAEERFLERAGRDLRQLLAQPPAWVGGKTRIHIWQRFCLLLD